MSEEQENSYSPWHDCPQCGEVKIKKNRDRCHGCTPGVDGSPISKGDL